MTWHRRKVVTGLAVGVLLPTEGCRGTTTTVRQGLLFSTLRSGRQITSAAPEKIQTVGWDEASLRRQHTGAADYIRSKSVTEAYVRANPLTSFHIRDTNGEVHGYRLAMSVITPQMLGVPGDGSGSIHPALLALAGTRMTMAFPSGTYLLDNLTLHQINDYTGTLRFASGARLICRHADRTGLYFYGGAPRIEGLMLITRRLSTTRQLDAPMLYLNSSVGPVLTNVTIEGGAGAGIVLRQSHDASLSHIIVRDVLADGLDLFNCSRFTVSDVSTDGTGDDGVAVLDYRDGPRITGGMLRNIRVRNSDTRGITMVGPAGVTLDGFQIENTRGSGLLIGEDATNGLRVPDACTAINGVIRRAGHRAVAGSYSGNQYGIEVARSDRVELHNIQIIDSATRGLSATSDRPGALLITTRISVEGAKAEGIHVRNQTAWSFDAITASDTGGAGIYAGRIARLRGGVRTAIRAAQSGVPNRAIWDEDNGNQSVAENRIIDVQDQPTGFVYYCQGAGTGSVGRFIWSVNGPFYYDVNARGMIVSGQPRDAGPADLTVGDTVTLGPLDPETQQLKGVATRPMTIILPRYGQFPGMAVTIMRSADNGPSIVRLIDGSRPGQPIATLPGDRAATRTIYWNAIASRWQASR